MISWMQKHNKYLVWTIWIATIAFIGAGFVGWGSYSFGSKAGNVAKVGEIEISHKQLNTAYSHLYNRYNQMFQGKFDEAKAKEMKLVQQAFASLATQAKILNFAKDHGIIVSDEEVAKILQSIGGFQKDGVFNKGIYDAYLQNQRMKAKDFEANLRDEIIINKTLSLFQSDILPLEEETVSAAFNIADKLSYKVLTPEDVNFNAKESDIKTYWEAHKTDFMTPKKYALSIVWTKTMETPVNDEELQKFYAEQSFNYTGTDGKQLSFEEAKKSVTADLKVKKTKKNAQKDYIAFKKGEVQNPLKVTLALGDRSLSKELWEEIMKKSAGEIIKPKVVGNRYATVRVETVIEPQAKSFEEAKAEAAIRYADHAKKEALLTLSESTLEKLSESNATRSGFLSLEQYDNLNGLNSQESLQFLQKLFTSSKEKGIISVSNKIVIYEILEQKFKSADANQTESIKKSVDQMKMRAFESNFIEMLDNMYPTEVYMGGLVN